MTIESFKEALNAIPGIECEPMGRELRVHTHEEIIAKTGHDHATDLTRQILNLAEKHNVTQSGGEGDFLEFRER